MSEVNDVIVRVNGADAFDAKVKDVIAALRDVGFCVIRGVFSAEDVLAEHARLVREFDRTRDIRRSGPIVARMANFQRLDCGDYAQINARFGRQLSRFFWNPPSHFSRHFAILRRVRDRVAGRDIDDREGLYEYDGRSCYELPKILQYPPGGGFLNGHVDGYNNIGMSVTKKGVHFSTGGIYYKYRDGRELLVEDVLEPGDCYMHDETAAHGIHAVDELQTIDLDRFSGRVSLILSSEVFGS
jgi:hypothetical protein